MKTSELTDEALDWAVAECQGHDFPAADAVSGIFNPSTEWSQGGPIIERERIAVDYRDTFDWWVAYVNGGTDEEYGCTGPTPLIAAMRCYVASVLGDEIELPTELGESK